MNIPRGKVAITGFGLISPLGSDHQQVARALSIGQSGLRWLSDERPSRNRGLAAGAPAKYESKFGHDPVIEMALQAAELAIHDSGIDLAKWDSDRIGCVIGTSKGLLDTYADDFAGSQTAIGYPGFQPNQAALQLALQFGAKGPCLSPIAACATGLASIARGVELIEQGYCDVVLAGSSDASICEWVLSSFHRLGVLAKNFDDPTEAVRPFADDRSGFLVGEGAAVFVLEREQLAAQRDAQVRARWLGVAYGSDPTGLTQIDTSGKNFAPVIQSALQLASISPEQVDFLNLHGTATLANDACEANAIELVFGDRDLNQRAYKSLIGHGLGAAGSMEVALSLLETGWNTQLKTSLGFGGHCFAAVLAIV